MMEKRYGKLRRQARWVGDELYWIEYELTLLERLQDIRAYILRYFCGGCLADYYTMEFEDLCCGAITNRHCIIRKVETDE